MFEKKFNKKTSFKWSAIIGKGLVKGYFIFER